MAYRESRGYWPKTRYKVCVPMGLR
jgi:hypothetical protein